MNTTSTVTQKGQVTIPIVYREKFGLQSGSRVAFSIKDSEILLKPVIEITSISGYFKSNKRFSKKKARKVYMKEVLANKI